MAEADKKNRTFRKFSFRGVELDDLLEMPLGKLLPLLNARQRRKFSRGISHKTRSFLKKLSINKKNCAYGEKPKPVNTHMRNLTIVPEMIGSVVGVHRGKEFTNVEIKPDMIGNYLGEYALTYKPVSHVKGAGGASRFVPLK